MKVEFVECIRSGYKLDASTLEIALSPTLKVKITRGFWPLKKECIKTYALDDAANWRDTVTGDEAEVHIAFELFNLLAKQRFLSKLGK